MALKSPSRKYVVYGLAGLMALASSLGLGLLVVKAQEALSSVNATIVASLIAGSATILVSVLSVLVSKHLDRKAAVLAQLRENKVAVCEKVIEFVFNILFWKARSSSEPDPGEAVKRLAQIVQELAIWGSDEMLIAFHRFIDEQVNGPRSESMTMARVAELFLAIRKELGQKSKGISKENIITILSGAMIKAP